jgi:hypothetical protein
VENPIDDAVEMIILNNMKAVVCGCGGGDCGGDSVEVVEDDDDYDRVRLMSENRGHHWPIVHRPGESEWRAMVMMMMLMPAGDSS